MQFLMIFCLSFAYFFNPLQANDLYSGKESVFIPYSNSEENPHLERSPKIKMGFNGSSHHISFVMDTGSIGIIASADIFQPAPDAINLGPGSQYYSSSGIIEEGTWWSATQQFYNREGRLIATSNVPVLQVTSVRCAENARHCREKDHPRGITMLGIGFARKSKQQPRGTSQYNAFLNIQSIHKNGKIENLPQNWCNGYVVTSKGIHLGLNSENTAKAGFVKLETSGNEWKAPSMEIIVNGSSGIGTILMDTGVATAFLSPPKNANLNHLVVCSKSSLVQCAPRGTVIEVYLPNQANRVAQYGFVVGQRDNPMHPEGVHVVKHSYVFFNTSRKVLNGFNYIYDHTNGYVGYQKNN